MKNIFLSIFVFALSCSALAQVVENPIKISDDRLVELVVDQEKEISYTEKRGEFGLPLVVLNTYVTVDTCLDTFPEIESALLSLSYDFQTQEALVQLFVTVTNNFSTCIGFDSRPIAIPIDPGATEPKVTSLRQENGKKLLITTQTKIVDGEWQIQSVEIEKNQ